MKLSDNDLLLLSHSAISAALQAGKLIADYSKRDFSVERKTGGESDASQVVTEVDRLSQDLILKILIPTCDIYDLGMLAEESVDDGTRLEKDYFWCIDPLDGTLPFVEKSPGYSAVISLIDRSGVPLIGVIYDPLKQNLYHAIKGQGAFLNGNVWEIPSAKDDGIFTFISDRSFAKNELFPQAMEELDKIVQEFGYKKVKRVMHGGGAMNALWVVENFSASYFKFPRVHKGGGCFWDYAASACIFTEMGLLATDMFGEALQLNRPGCTFMNHAGVLYACNSDIQKRIIDMYAKLVN